MNASSNRKPSAFPVESSLAAFEQAKSIWLASHPQATHAERDLALRRIAMEHGQAVAVPIEWPEGGK